MDGKKPTINIGISSGDTLGGASEKMYSTYHMYVCMYACMHVRTYVWMYVCMYLHKYVRTYGCMYYVLCTYVRMYVCHKTCSTYAETRCIARVALSAKPKPKKGTATKRQSCRSCEVPDRDIWQRQGDEKIRTTAKNGKNSAVLQGWPGEVGEESN